LFKTLGNISEEEKVEILQTGFRLSHSKGENFVEEILEKYRKI
jgi:hypothetical protein